MRTRQGVEGEVIVKLLKARLVGANRNDLHNSAYGAGIVLDADQFSAVKKGTKCEDSGDKRNSGNYTQTRYRSAANDSSDNVHNHQSPRENAQSDYIAEWGEGTLAYAFEVLSAVSHGLRSSDE